MADWIRKSGPQGGRVIEATLQDELGPVDLPVGTTAQIRIKQPGDPAAWPALIADVEVVAPGALEGDPDRGRVRYTPGDADLVPGVFDVDFKATIPINGAAYFPEDGYMYLLVLEGADSV